MVAFNNNYFMDAEDGGGFGSDAVSQNDALASFIQPPAQPAAPATPSQPLTFADLTKLYNEKGATTTTSYENEQGTQYDTQTNDLGDGWMAWEKPGEVSYTEGSGESATNYYAPGELGGFSQKDGDYVNFYDLNGTLVDRQKWNESALKSAWSDLGPVAMAALTMGGGAGALGNALFGLEGAAAAGAGGALAGGVNAAMTDQNILTGALKGGLGSAGALQLGDTGVTLGDVNKAVSFIENPSLAGALNVAAPAIGDVKIGDGAISLNDVAKSLNTAAALSSGNPQQIFNAIVGLDRSANTPLKTSLGPGDAQEFSDNLIPGYFQPGGEGYVAPEATNPVTVQQEPFNIDELLSQLDQFKQSAVTAEDIQNIISGQNFATPEDIQTAINTIDIPTGLSEQDVQAIVSNAFAENPNIKIEDVQSVVDAAVSKIPTGVSQEDLTRSLGATEQNVLAQVGKQGEQFQTLFDQYRQLGMDADTALRQTIDDLGTDVSGQLSDVKSQIAGVETGLGQKMSQQGEQFQTLLQQYRDLGMDENEALRQTIDDLGANVSGQLSQQGEQFQTLLQQYRDLGMDENEALRQTIDDLSADVGGQISGLRENFKTQIEDVGTDVADIATALGTTKEDLTSQILSQGEDFTGQLSGLRENFKTQIGDVNTQITDIADALGTTKEELINQLNLSQDELESLFGSEVSGLRENFKNQIEDVNTEITSIADALGTTEEELMNRLNLSESELRNLIGNVGAQTQTVLANQAKAQAAQNTAMSDALSQAQSTANLNTLMMLMNDGQQQPAQQAPMQDPYAHIKLMEDLFGSNIDLTPAGENTAQRK